jgi:hypothetical protein
LNVWKQIPRQRGPRDHGFRGLQAVEKRAASPARDGRDDEASA